MTAVRLLGSLSLAVVVGVCAVAALAKPPAPKKGAATHPAEEIKPLAPAFTLGAQSGTPTYLKFFPDTLPGLDGVTGGGMESTETNFADKDFVFDVVMHFEKGVNETFFGIGTVAGSSKRNEKAVMLRWSGRSEYCEISRGRGGEIPPTRIPTDGTNLLRMTKAGETLTFTVATRDTDRGPFKVAYSKAIPGLKDWAKFLTDQNAILFVGGEGTITSVALSVDGKLVDAGKPAADPAALAKAAGIEQAPWVSLAGAAGVPSWLSPSTNTFGDADGLTYGVVRTVANDLSAHDFVCDLLFKMTREEERSTFTVGFGEGGHEGGWILNSIYCRVGGPANKGSCKLGVGKTPYETHVGALGTGLGPHLIRFEKHGTAVTIGLCPDYKDKYVPAFARTIPDLQQAAPFLSKLNGGIFYEGNRASRLTAARLVVDGNVVPNTAPVASRGPADDAALNAAIDRVPLVNLVGQAALPEWLKADRKVLGGPEGMSGGELRSTDHDLASKDFTLDVLYAIPEDARGDFLVGIGENGHDGGAITNSVLARLLGPARNGKIQLVTPRGQFDGPIVGETSKAPGPHLLRLQKRGNTLTFAISADFKDKFDPTFSTTVPDLARVAPFLNRTNGAAFITGDGQVKGVRLVIGDPRVGVAGAGGRPAGGSAGAADAPAPSAPSGSTATSGAKPAAATAAAIAAVNGAENLIPLTGPKLPDYFKQQRDLQYTPGGLTLQDNKELRTARSDYTSKNFTFDVVYRIAGDEPGPLLVGIGENGREGGWILNSVVAQLHGERQDGAVGLVIGKEEGSAIGKTGKISSAVAMVRLQKQGNTLTVAVCPDFQGKFEPLITRTIPDLRTVAPFLTEKNGALFVSGKATIEKVRLVVDGEATESLDVALGLPPNVVEGQAVKLQLGRAAKGGPAVRYSIELAPKGMSLTSDGQLTWTPSHEQLGVSELRIKVARGGADPPIVVPGTVNVVSADDAKAVKGDLAKVDALYRLPIATQKYKLVDGLDGASMLLLDGDTLKRLDRDGITVRETLKLPARYTLIGERPDYLVAVSDEKQSLDILDKKSLAVRKSIQMIYRNRWDLALDPSRATSYVTVEKGAEGARDVVLIVDEATGEVVEPGNFVGRWIKIAPDGRTAYTGYKDIYEKGSRLLVNPDRIDIIPEYGSIDVLYVWDLSTGRPRPLMSKGSPGLNGYGIALSPDGKRLSYLSYTGYPLYSHDVPAFDPTDFQKRPVTYPTKANKAESQDIAFHPYLPIAAAPNEDGAVCFDRESGQVLSGLVNLTAPPIGEVKAKHVYFSPDGRNLLIECDNGADRYLRKVKLNLSPTQVEQIKSLEKQQPRRQAPQHVPHPTGVGLPKA